MASLVLQNIVKKYGDVTALNNVSLEIEDGEFVVLLGPSGAGKTTMLKIIAGIETVQEGYVYMDGELMNPVEPHLRDVAMAYESYALYPHYTVYENLAFPLRHPRLNMAEKTIDKAVRDIAELLNIGDLLDRQPNELSNGQKQRTSLGRCLVRRPKIFLLDEPLSHLDAKLRHDMRTEFKRLESAIDTTTIYVTHDYVEALSLAERIITLEEGVIRQIGTPTELYNRPINEFVAKLLGEPQINLIDGNVKSDDGVLSFISADGQIKVPLKGEIKGKVEKNTLNEVRLGIRPLYIEVLNSQAEESDQLVEGLVYVYEHLGTKGMLTTTVGDTRLVALTDVDLDFQADEPVKIGINEDKIMLFDAESGNNVITM